MTSKMGPKDFGLKVGSKAESFWQRVLDAAEKAQEDAENTAELQAEVVKIARERVRVEREAFKKS